MKDAEDGYMVPSNCIKNKIGGHDQTSDVWTQFGTRQSGKRKQRHVLEAPINFTGHKIRSLRTALVKI
jgi:hypothetical protein